MKPRLLSSFSAEYSALGLATWKLKAYDDHLSSHGGCAWETFGSAGFLLLRFANPRTAATQLFGDD
ncbi:hypothetical protein C1X35_16060 [Pseudomonas sp. FW306-1C-G01A]|nr:hypothetical protein [Pseudomonas mandelii]PMV85844.1 hypothetical protein C1X56_16950 [Pseudomonas sp. GW101-1A09]PMV87689.1 hypothetical protein C1X51_27270 [Pseudomonas sp. FW306-2-2C-B10A]PMV91451.1 hypothetical protein C1X55_30925 [Pseudomonas sp. GW460-C8]PMW07309.1 hypothetical protein C1X50_04145 [Pseudomonas sp. MPR-TSA4]PMW09131.1 hypothetical protein C1X52_26525 [Pseudomonas sp. FW306-2-1A-C05A]PMW14178.1 hypothetical protein C1X53_28590 [Pseudomonas sp. GW456-E6]PMW25901.1 hyp